MTVLHCLSEYLIIFGTPLGTEGFSGRYRIDIVDFVTAGEMWTDTEQSCSEPIVTRPGGRGPIVTGLPMALTDTVTCLDGKTIWKTLSVSARLTGKELRRGKM